MIGMVVEAGGGKWGGGCLPGYLSERVCFLGRPICAGREGRA